MITTLTGSNSFLLKSELDRRIAEFVDEYGDMGLEKLDGEEAAYESLVAAVQNLPFLASRKLVVLRNPGANKAFAEAFESIIETIPETNDVLLYEPKLDRRSGYAKLLQKKTDLVRLDHLNERDLPKWLVETAKSQGGTLGLSDAVYLINRVGADQQFLHHEIDKLINYQPQITRETIDLLTEPAPQSTIFQLLEAAFSGNTRRALELYDDQRAQAVEPQAIIPMLAWQLHALAIVKTAGDRPADEIAAASKLNPFVVRKSSAIVKKMPLAKLKSLIHNLRTLDVRLKSESIDADEALRHYLITLSQD